MMSAAPDNSSNEVSFGVMGLPPAVRLLGCRVGEGSSPRDPNTPLPAVVFGQEWVLPTEFYSPFGGFLRWFAA